MSKFRNHLADYPDDDYYLERMKDILEGYPKLGPLQHPSKLLEHIYIGNQDNADNVDLLQALEITHVLNVAGTRNFDLTRSPYRKDTGIVGFLMIPAEDYEEYDMMQHFMDSIIFLDKAKTSGGRALVHCSIGVNRSGAVVAAYLMVHQKRPLLKVIEDLKSKRSLILQNVGFRRQLVRFARCRGLLDLPDLPPKKLNFDYISYVSVNRERKNGVNLDRNETVKTLPNGTPSAEEESPKEPQEPPPKEASDADQPPKDAVSGEGTQTLNGAEEKASSSSASNGQEKEDAENADEKKNKSYSKSSYQDDPDLRKNEKIKAKSEKAFPHSDLGPWEDKREQLMKKVRVSLDPAANLTSSSIYDFEYRPSGNDVELSALSLELPRYKAANSGYSSSRHSYSEVMQGSSGLENSASSSLSHASRESSSSGRHITSIDDDLAGRGITSLERSRYSLPHVSGHYLESDIYQNKPQEYTTPLPRANSTLASTLLSGKFVSNVKPISYYQRLVAPSPSNDFHMLNGFDTNGFSKTFQDETERESFWKTKPLQSNGYGTLFDPYVASPKATYSQRNGVTDILYEPRPYVDKSYALENISSKFDLYDRNFYNSLSSHDFPQWRNSGTSYTSSSSSSSSSYGARPSYRRTADYDDALDEYSDLLEASLGKSEAYSAAAKSRIRSGKSSGVGRFPAYRY